MSESRIVIHRDRTFEYEGRKYQAIGGGHGWGYAVTDYESGRTVDSGTYMTLREIREQFNGPEGEIPW